MDGRVNGGQKNIRQHVAKENGGDKGWLGVLVFGLFFVGVQIFCICAATCFSDWNVGTNVK